MAIADVDYFFIDGCFDLDDVTIKSKMSANIYVCIHS